MAWTGTLEDDAGNGHFRLHAELVAFSAGIGDVVRRKEAFVAVMMSCSSVTIEPKDVMPSKGAFIMHELSLSLEETAT